ncbi:MAG: DUF2877 domain-containing protein [Bacteriovoracaceae bacterium]|nr:DUF2877 domain-containing protein [Bacteriovoracaceae bacterium]
MRLLSYGDSLETGSYKLHSTFKNVINFTGLGGKKDIVSLVKTPITDAPNHLVFDYFASDLTSVTSLIITDHQFIAKTSRTQISFAKADCDDCKTYVSTFELPKNYTLEQLEHNIQSVKKQVCAYSQDAGLSFLLDNKTKQAASTNPFEREFKIKVTKDIDKFFSPHWIQGAQGLRGCGPGLTPSGDDFLLGSIIAIILLTPIMDSAKLPEINVIADMAKSDNLISNNMFFWTVQKKYTGMIKQLIQVLTDINPTTKKLNQCVNEVTNLGSTSGVDLLVGLILSIQRRHQWQLKQ